MSLESIYLKSAVRRFQEYKAIGDKALQQLSVEQLNYAPNAASNSIATIIRHMHGNMLSRWTNFLTEDGEKSWRQRDKEFEAKSSTKEDIMQWWAEGWQLLFDTLESLTAADLSKTITIRSEPLDVIDAINRQLAHYPAHVGQLAYIGKMLKGSDWESPSIARGGTEAFNQTMAAKDWQR